MSCPTWPFFYTNVYDAVFHVSNFAYIYVNIYGTCASRSYLSDMSELQGYCVWNVEEITVPGVVEVVVVVSRRLDMKDDCMREKHSDYRICSLTARISFVCLPLCPCCPLLSLCVQVSVCHLLWVFPVSHSPFSFSESSTPSIILFFQCVNIILCVHRSPCVLIFVQISRFSLLRALFRVESSIEPHIHAKKEEYTHERTWRRIIGSWEVRTWSLVRPLYSWFLFFCKRCLSRMYYVQPKVKSIRETTLVENQAEVNEAYAMKIIASQTESA